MSAKKNRKPWNAFPMATLDVRGLSPCAADCLRYLGMRSNHLGETIVGQNRMREDMNGRSKDYVTSGLKELEKKGIITTIGRKRSDSKADKHIISRSILSEEYRKVLDALENNDPAKQENSPSNDPAKQDDAFFNDPAGQDFDNPAFGSNNPAEQAQTLQIEPRSLKPTLTEAEEQDQNQVSKLVSEETSLASLATSDPQRLVKQKPYPDQVLWQEQTQEPHPFWSEALGRGFDTEEVNVIMDLYLDLLPNGNMAHTDLILLGELALQWGIPYLRAIWFWNHLHKQGGLKFRTIEALANGLGSESDNNICAQMTEHDFVKCPKCKKLRMCTHCGEREDGTECRDYMESVKHGYYPAGGYMHKGCGLGWYESEREARL